MSGARIAEVMLDQGVKSKLFVQLAWEQQPSIGSDRRSPELDSKLRIEREANRGRSRVTHWMMPSPPARHYRSPHFPRALSDYALRNSPLKTKMQV